MINSKHLMILAGLEGLVMASAVLRIVLPGGLDFAHPPTLAWFVATMILAASSITHFVLRSSMLGARMKAGENVEEDRKQIMTISVAIVVGAAMLSLAGPSLFAELMR